MLELSRKESVMPYKHNPVVQEMTLPQASYNRADERLRLLLSSGKYQVVKRYHRSEDEEWPFVYLLVAVDQGNTFHIFTRQRVG
jgi:hypothetical protein